MLEYHLAFLDLRLRQIVNDAIYNPKFYNGFFYKRLTVKIKKILQKSRLNVINTQGLSKAQKNKLDKVYDKLYKEITRDIRGKVLKIFNLALERQISRREAQRKLIETLYNVDYYKVREETYGRLIHKIILEG